MPQPLLLHGRPRGRLATYALGLAFALTLGWPLGLTGAEPPDDELRTLPLGDGLEQVLADDAGHRFDRRSVRDVAIDSKGTIWAIQGRHMIQLGGPGSIAPRSPRWGDAIRRLEVDHEGRPWALEDGGTVSILVDDVLVDRSGDQRGAGISLAVLPDGRIWRTVRVPERRSSIVATTDGSSWQEIPSHGLEELLGPGSARHTFAQTHDGRVWLGVDRGTRGGGLAVMDDLGWTVVDDEDAGGELRVRALEPHSDGSLWALADVGRPGAGARHVLVHLQDDRLEVLGEDEGMPQDSSLAWTGWSPLEPSTLAVTESGAVWFSVGDTGLWTYDGTAFDRLDVPGLRRGALDLERAPDGSIWIVGRSGGLYRLDEAPNP